MKNPKKESDENGEISDEELESLKELALQHAYSTYIDSMSNNYIIKKPGER